MTTVAIAVVLDQGRVLVGRRPQGVPLAGLLEFPGGKVRDGECPRDAAARECLEETAVAIEAREALAVVTHDYPHGRVELHFFGCAPCDAGAAPRPPYCWLAVERLSADDFPPANAAIIARLGGDSRGPDG
jgi:mutator protein MutT